MPVTMEKPVIGIARQHLPVCMLDDELDQVEMFTERLDKVGFPAVGALDVRVAGLIGDCDDLAELYTRRTQIRDLEEKLLRNLDFHGIVGRSPAMVEVFEMARRWRVITRMSW